MKKASASSTRKPPEPADGHGDIDDLMSRMMPDLQPLVRRLDELIRASIPKAQFAVKWKKAYYGLADKGWLIEIVAYDVSVNAVFLGGAAFENPPPLGEGDGRYVKLTSLEEAESADVERWIKEAAKHAGWK